MCNTPHCCLPQESGPYLSPSVTAHPLRPATRQSLGRPSPHQQADRPRAHPPPKHHKSESFPATPCGTARTPRISHPFKRLSRSEGQVTHVLLTRSPLTHPAKNKADPFDLHVLSTPPAFVLSQDQTLQKKQTNQKKQDPATTTTTHHPTQDSTQQQPQPENKTTRQNKPTHQKAGKPWHKKQAHYRDLKQHTHRRITRPPLGEAASLRKHPRNFNEPPSSGQTQNP